MSGGDFGSTGMTPPPPPDPTASAAPPAQTSWPTVLGIISIVFGSGAALCGCFNAVAAGFTEKLMSMGPQQDDPTREAMIEATSKYMPLAIGVNVVGTLLGILCLVAAIMLLRRSRASAAMFVIWALLKLPYAIAYAAHQWLVTVEMGKVFEDVDQAPQGMASMMSSFGAVFSILYAVWFAALPIFILIWFARGSIRNEMRQWGTIERI